MSIRNVLLACSVVAAGILVAPVVYAEEASTCCVYSEDCDGKTNGGGLPIPYCCVIGADCSLTFPGVQGYCMTTC
jgi:hypothetical protein